MDVSTLRSVEPPPAGWSAYEGTAPADLLDRGRALALPLRGARVVHINATGYGGGVAELLASEVALMRDLGIDAHWRLICPDTGLFGVTKALHNALQGAPLPPGLDMDLFEGHGQHCADMLADEWDVVVVHDPQPLPMRSFDPAPSARWLWRCHIDTSVPDPLAWAALRDHVRLYDGVVFTLDAFVPPGLGDQDCFVIPPAIDPFATKNATLPRFVTHQAMAATGIDLGRPVMVQVSRFDPWKDPLGVVDAWRLARERVEGLQLALVGSMADDDPQGWDVYESVQAATTGEPDCHLLSNLTGIGALEVNAFQREADVVVQKSTREGFGLTVSEAMWKRTPVVGGAVGGIPLQIGSNEGGILVTGAEECAHAVVALVHDSERAANLADAGRERVRRNFLIPRMVADDLAAYATILGAP